eukprot:10630980-Prorocentrum_lima.AAC.1
MESLPAAGVAWEGKVRASAAKAATILPRAAGQITPPDTATNNETNTNTNTLTKTQGLVEVHCFSTSDLPL